MLLKLDVSDGLSGNRYCVSAMRYNGEGYKMYLPIWRLQKVSKG